MHLIDTLLSLHIVPLGLALLALLVRGRVGWALVLAASVWAVFPVLTVASVPLQGQPFPDAAEYADAAFQMAHGNGYVTLVHGNGPEPPRYPPGFSLALTPFSAFGDYPWNVQMAARAFAVLYVLAAVSVAGYLAGPPAATLTAIFTGSSPFASVAGSLVLSDALSACLTLTLVPMLRSAGRRQATLAGLTTGLLTSIRLSALLTLPVAFMVARGRSRLLILAGAAPVLLAVGIFQWQTFGSPLRTGYDYWLPGVQNFGVANAVARDAFGDGPWIVADRLGGALMQWVCPCIQGGPQATAPDVLLYPAILFGFFWTFSPPLIGLLGLAYLWRRRREPDAQFGLALIALSLAFYCAYFYQATRFMAPPATLLAVYGAVGIAIWTRAGLARLRPYIHIPTSPTMTQATPAAKIASSRSRSRSYDAE